MGQLYLPSLLDARLGARLLMARFKLPTVLSPVALGMSGYTFYITNVSTRSLQLSVVSTSSTELRPVSIDTDFADTFTVALMNHGNRDIAVVRARPVTATEFETKQLRWGTPEWGPPVTTDGDWTPTVIKADEVKIVSLKVVDDRRLNERQTGYFVHGLVLTTVDDAGTTYESTFPVAYVFLEAMKDRALRHSVLSRIETSFEALVSTEVVIQPAVPSSIPSKEDVVFTPAGVAITRP